MLHVGWLEKIGFVIGLRADRRLYWSRTQTRRMRGKLKM